MNGREEFRSIVEEIDYLLAERRQRAVERMRLIVVHGYHKAVTDCLPGETIEQVCISVRSDLIPLRLSPTGLVIADVIVRKKPRALTASHIEHILASDPFYLRLGANAGPAQRAIKRPTRRSIKVYIKRLRQQIGRILKEAGLTKLPEKVLASEGTDLLNVTAYRFAIPCDIIHLGATAGRR
jgi:hypothetical protein